MDANGAYPRKQGLYWGERFRDHVRIENLLFDGTLTPEPGGLLRPDTSRPGLGLTPVPERAERYRLR